MSRTVLDDIWCLTFFCNAELFKKKKNIKFIQAVLNMQIAELGNKDVLQNSTGPSLFDVVVSIKMQRMLKCSYSPTISAKPDLLSPCEHRKALLRR